MDKKTTVNVAHFAQKNSQFTGRRNGALVCESWQSSALVVAISVFSAHDVSMFGSVYKASVVWIKQKTVNNRNKS